MIFAGELREKLAFYKIVETQTQSGYKSTEEVFMFECRAGRTKNQEMLVVDADEIFHSNKLTFRLRYHKEVDETNIVVYDGDRYNISGINPWVKDGEMVITLIKINE